MKKIYNAPQVLCIELQATKMMALSMKDDTISSGNMDDFEQNTRQESDWDIW